MDAKSVNTYLLEQAIAALEECKNSKCIGDANCTHSVSYVLSDALRLKEQLSASEE